MGFEMGVVFFDSSDELNHGVRRQLFDIRLRYTSGFKLIFPNLLDDGIGILFNHIHQPNLDVGFEGVNLITSVV